MIQGFYALFMLTIDEVVETANEQVLAASLRLAPVGIVVHVADGLPGAQPADDEGVPVGVDHVHKVCIRLVQAHIGGVSLKQIQISGGETVFKHFQQGEGRSMKHYLEQRACWVKAGDAAEVGELLAHEAGDVGAEGEADQVGVVVDGLPGLRAQLVDQSSHLGTSRLDNWREHDKMSVHESFLSVKALLGTPKKKKELLGA